MASEAVTPSWLAEHLWPSMNIIKLRHGRMGAVCVTNGRRCACAHVARRSAGAVHAIAGHGHGRACTHLLHACTAHTCRHGHPALQ